ncbi:MAG: phosphatidylglycerophosphatase A [Candidatus Marinimicrobia bacterium]|nr:phosphatidylglycerophosphatase A [Candidatus Neomarinimicrobiota bacterium]|tara:strand:- start:1919 stop:2359 length:441 start_codon:yes stop_codon:yes gene_type:complete
MKFIYKSIITFFFVGNIQFAPGTIASMFAMLVWFFIPLNLFIQLSIILILLFLSLFLCYIHSIESNIEDPSYIVIDEVIGMFISLFMLPKQLSFYLLAFMLFRIFDILKPSIIYNAQDLKHGVGIIADDILAGLFTIIILNSILFL